MVTAAMCCPYLVNGECTIAAALRLCSDGTGRCVVLRSRCCGTLRLADGTVVNEWETCSFYRRAADCRYCSHYDRERNYCRMHGREVRYHQGTCPHYDGPRPVPSLARS